MQRPGAAEVVGGGERSGPPEHDPSGLDGAYPVCLSLGWECGNLVSLLGYARGGVAGCVQYGLGPGWWSAGVGA